MTSESTLSPDYKISIPKTLCESMAWKPGQKIALIAKSEGVLMVAIPKREELAGFARGADPNGYRDRNDRF